MFKFDFDITEEDNSEELLDLGLESLTIHDSSAGENTSLELEPFSEITLSQLLDGVPDQISYSPLFIPLSSTRKSTCLLRRDLFDARFQLISEGAGDDNGVNQGEKNTASESSNSTTARKALEFLDAPSDLVPGVYEGGLKTWECSLDLVDYLDGLKETSDNVTFFGKKILEVGCGTGVPSMYIFRELVSSEIGDTPPKRTVVHLQDYNISVLQLVTLPNILLTWYTSPHADAYRTSMNDDDMAPTIHNAASGELPITPEFKAAFLGTLQNLNITLRFFAGSWDTFNPVPTSSDPSESTYDILLTSETIYRNESLPPLVGLMQRAFPVDSANANYFCLVAAKVLYFGVGGGVSEFLKAAEKEKATVETVLERTSGVGRKILRVWW